MAEMTVTYPVRDARMRLGMSQRELGRRSGLPQDHLWRLESGKIQNPSALTLIKIALALDLDFKDLILITDEKGEVCEFFSRS